MKQKKRTLSLNKQTIAKLGKDELNEIKGGKVAEAARTKRICYTSNGANWCWVV